MPGTIGLKGSKGQVVFRSAHMSAYKAELRRWMRQRLATQTATQRAAADTRICENLQTFLQMLRLRRLLAFAPSGHEPNIRPVLEWVLQKGIRLAFPVGGATEIFFREVPHLGFLRTGPWGILEPDASCATVTAEDLTESAVALVPGVAFCQDGLRLGRGQGYYDRFLARYPTVYSVGVCYSVQLLEELPCQRWDQRVQALCTEQGVVPTAGLQNR